MQRMRQATDQVFTVMVWIAAAVALAVLATILVHVISRGAPRLSWEFLTQNPRRMGREGGILPTILGTVYLTAVAVLVASPVGVAAAVYLSDYARQGWVTRTIRFATETLAGVPSIIFGIFGFAFLVTYLKLGWSILSGGLTLAFMILPTIVRTSEEAIQAVPGSYREGSLALGATRWQTVRRVVIPAASPGIVTGIVLGIGRAIGETAAVILTAGSSLLPPRWITDPTRTMSVHLYILATEGISMPNAYGTATVLVVVILAINGVANYLRRRMSAVLAR
ncbi:MAG: phosphate ABC transporter permease PstA [Firmicutes bacterium]|nr:phosphate ABC transporter permease PstA [Bacillota bacterium]